MMPQTVPVRLVPRCLTQLWRWRAALLVSLALSWGMMIEAHAATTWTVCASGCDYTSIKSAIAASTTLGGDTLAIGAGTYTEPGITVSKSLTLQGAGAASTTVQAASSPGMAPDRVFAIPSGVIVTIRELTVRYGNLCEDYTCGVNGGGIWNNGTLTLTNSTVSGNTAPQGGGLATGYGSRLTLTNSTVSGNTALWAGGGLANPSTDVSSAITLINSTVSGNTALAGGARWGGGIWSSEGRVTLSNSTVSGNAAHVGGGLFIGYSRLTLTNSLVTTNPQGKNCHISSASSVISNGYNLDSDGSCQLTAPTDQPSTDPLLGPLQNNGGLTRTRALLSGSPAIDAVPWGTNGCGSTLISDQRWRARPQPAGGACDIGAYEVEVAGQVLGGWVTGLTPSTVVCQNVPTGHNVTLSSPASPWDCEAAGLGVTPGDQVAQRVRGPVKTSATDIGGAVGGMVPSSGGCTNLTTGQQVTFQHMRGATAASCVAAGLVVHPGDRVQMRVQGAVE